MEIPLPNTPQASRPGKPEDFGPTFENCRKLQELTSIIDLYSTTLESLHLLLKGVMQSGIKDPNNPIIRKETSYMELTNKRLQQAVNEAPKPRLPDSIDHPIGVMPPSRMQNSTLAMPLIEDLSRYGIEDCSYSPEAQKSNAYSTSVYSRSEVLNKLGYY
ncbi:uncharacterized protein TNCV_2380251 [Trichonephila clavipes]|nr:uncharacterized protein TNCV_2380251 [Trichonephila clavipes]